MPDDDVQSRDDARGGGRVRTRARQQSNLVVQAIRRTAEGDRGALHFLYVRYAPELNDHVNGVLHDQGESDATVQAVFAELGTSIAGFDSNAGSFGAWIQRRAANAALERLHARPAAAAEKTRAIDDSAGHSQISR